MRISLARRPSILAFVFAAALATGLLVAPDAYAPPVTWCLNVTAGNTPVATGYGSTCTAAYNAARAAANQLANEICWADGFPITLGACFDDFIVTSACSWTGSQWQLSGYTKYRCRDYL
jgi:hypothetical protein